MDNYTREELETEYPEGSVSIQDDDTIRTMTSEEWSQWIDTQVGLPKVEPR